MPEVMMAKRSGNPSRLTSPSLNGSGSGGWKVVSSTRRLGGGEFFDAGKISDRGKLTKSCKFPLEILNRERGHR